MEMVNGGNLRTKDTAKFLGIGRSTLHDWVAKGILPPGVKIGPRARVWPVRVLEDFVKQRGESKETG
jgi:predicted DNA-binding transcriptional regulator AlpA